MTAMPKPVSRFGSLLAALFCVAAMAAAAPAAEAGFKLGPEEKLRSLEDVRLQTSAKEALFIGHKVTFYWLGLPFTFSDDGYILGVKGKQVYYPLDKNKLGEWQAQGLLPNPLPAYELSAADYVFGHLLWVVLAASGLWTGARALYARRRRKPPAASPVAPVVAPASAPPARVAQAVGVPPPVKAPQSPAVAPVPEKAAVAPTPAPARAVPAPSAPQQQMPPPAQAPSPRPGPVRATSLSATELRAEAAKLPIAKTVCRVKAIKAA